MKIAPVACDLRQKRKQQKILTFIHTYMRNLFNVFSPGKSKKQILSLSPVTPLLKQGSKKPK